MQVPQWAGPIPIGRTVDLGPRAIPEGWVHDTDTSNGPGFPFFNWQVVVEYMFLELF